MQISNDGAAFNAFPIRTKKSELIAQIICHNVKELFAMDKQALMERHLEILKKDADLVEGAWYWVIDNTGRSWVAKRDTEAAGGWTNEDTWEDYLGEVKRWERIKEPTF